MTLAKDIRAKAEAALAEKAPELRAWVARGLDRLIEVRAAIPLTGVEPDNVGQLYMHAHALKGAAAQAGLDLASRIAASLCELLDDEDHAPAEQMGLVDDHIDALRLTLQQNLPADHPAAVALIEELKRDMTYR